MKKLIPLITIVSLLAPNCSYKLPEETNITIDIQDTDLERKLEKANEVLNRLTKIKDSLYTVLEKKLEEEADAISKEDFSYTTIRIKTTNYNIEKYTNDSKMILLAKNDLIKYAFIFDNKGKYNEYRENIGTKITEEKLLEMSDERRLDIMEITYNILKETNKKLRNQKLIK